MFLIRRTAEKQKGSKKTMFPDSNVNTVSQNVEQKPGVSEKYRTGYNDSSSNIKDKNYLKILEGNLVV